MTGIKIEVEGDPIPLARARAGKNRFYDPQYIAKRNFASEVTSQTKMDKVIDTQLAFDIIFVIKEPKSWSKKKKAKFLDQPHTDRKSTRLNSSHIQKSRMPSSA